MGDGAAGPMVEVVGAPDEVPGSNRSNEVNGAGAGAGAPGARRAHVGRRAAVPSRWDRALHFWRSPDDQPSWARPALLAVAALAALSYAWGIGNDTVETFYGAAVRSMSESWHNFVFGSFDPWGTISIDKLPGAFWLQALSVRLFGFHVWSLVLPQVAEGTLTVLVIYRALRRVAGPVAGLAAAVVLAATPVTIMLNRGNVSDSLLILLLVLAADATTKAMTTGRLASLLVAGVWVGFAFQAKMLQAWLVLPALFLAYVLAAPNPDLIRRVGHVVLCGLVALGVSLTWMVAISVVPQNDRPYVDASCNDSVFSQVFLYNAADRLSGRTLDQPACNPAATRAQGPGGPAGATVPVPEGPGRFLDGTFGRDLDWLLLPAAVAFAGILVVRRREPRTDPFRAAAVLWAAWLFFTWCFFASSHFLNSYYLAALAPPIAALCGLGLVEAWRSRSRTGVRVVVVATVVAGTAYVLDLLPTSAGVRPWVLATTLILAVGALGATIWSLRLSAPAWSRDAAIALSAAALFVGSAWAAGSVVEAGLGPFDSPYQPAALTAAAPATAARTAALSARLQRTAAGVPPGVSVLTVETSVTASVPIMATGREYLPVGGFTGRVPSPTLAQFLHDVRSGAVTEVLVTLSPHTRNPDLLWVSAHCAPGAKGLQAINGSSGHRSNVVRLYRCTARDAGVTAADTQPS